MKQIDRRILRIAGPSIVSNITVPLLGLIDVAIVGHLGDAAYIGAIAVGSMMFNLIYWIFGFLRMGTSGMTSQALGRRDLTATAQLLLRSSPFPQASPSVSSCCKVRYVGQCCSSCSPRPTWSRLHAPISASVCGGACRARSLRTHGLVCGHAEHTHPDVHIHHAEHSEHSGKPHSCLWLRHARGGRSHGYSHRPVCRTACRPAVARALLWQVAALCGFAERAEACRWHVSSPSTATYSCAPSASLPSTCISRRQEHGKVPSYLP